MKGSTLIIMKALKEESIRINYFKNKYCCSWFGGMAVPSWIEGEWQSDLKN